MFRLDPSSGVPTYLQLVHQVRHAIREGSLREGDQLPTLKDVVSALAINPNTVAKAYRELEHEGLLEGRPGLGTFVVGTVHGPAPQEWRRLERDLDRWVDRARAAGLEDDGMVAMLRASIARDAVGGSRRAKGAA